MDLQSRLKEHRIESSKPIIFDLSQEHDQEKLSTLLTDSSPQIIDTYREQIEELLETRSPSISEEKLNKQIESYIQDQSLPEWQQGRWIYFPWRSVLCHLVNESEYFECRTNRNHHFISKDEQKAFYDSVIGVCGLSVGNSVALSLVLSGGAKHIKLADFDTFSITNLNRVRTGIQSFGEQKSTICAREIYELNPYAQVEIFSDGITEDTIDSFFNDPKLDIVVDELDNIGIKVLLREKARETKTPLIMATDNGDDGIIDIERHDIEQTAFFHGAIGDISYKELLNLSKPEIGKFASKIIGMQNVHSKMLGSLNELGKSLVSWPQLGNAATLNGTAVAYAARKILTKEPLKSGRSYLSLDQSLMPEQDYLAEQSKRTELINSMMNQQ